MWETKLNANRNFRPVRYRIPTRVAESRWTRLLDFVVPSDYPQVFAFAGSHHPAASQSPEMDNTARTNFPAYWVMTAVALIALVLILSETFDQMVGVWLTSTSFNHCVLIAPICAILIWQRRDRLARISYGPSAVGFLVFLVLAGAWMLGALGNLAVLQSFASVAMLSAAVWAICGNAVARELAFPLAYSLFMVPFGAFLVPWLMELTADFTVLAVRLSGVAVFKDGLYFLIPNGSFKIVEACSGLRMLIASVAIGVLFAHLSFRSWARRIIFVIAIVVMSLIGNTIRAYLVVMIANFRGIEAVADHITVGYIVFGVVLVLALAIGSRFTDIDTSDESAIPSSSASVAGQPFWYGALASAGIVAIGLSVAPAVTTVQARTHNYPQPPPVELPAVHADWSGPSTAREDWAPRFKGYDYQRLGQYFRGSTVIDVAIIAYWQQLQGAELINSSNRLFDVDRWTQLRVSEGALEITSGDAIRYKEIELQGANEDKRLFRYWYVIDGRPEIGPVRVKLRELQNLLLGRPTSAMLIAVSTVFVDNPDTARRSLDAFIRDVYANSYQLE